MAGDIKASTQARSDGRRALLTYLDPDLIKDLKVAALEDETNVYQIVEQAARDWLDQRAKNARKRPLRRKPEKP